MKDGWTYLLTNDFGIFGGSEIEEIFINGAVAAGKAVFFNVINVQRGDGVKFVDNHDPLDRARVDDPEANALHPGFRGFWQEFDTLSFLGGNGLLWGSVCAGTLLTPPHDKIFFDTPCTGKEGVGYILLQAIRRGHNHLIEIGKVHGQFAAVTDDYLAVRFQVIPSHFGLLAAFDEIGLSLCRAYSAAHLAFSALRKLEV